MNLLRQLMSLKVYQPPSCIHLNPPLGSVAGSKTVPQTRHVVSGTPLPPPVRHVAFGGDSSTTRIALGHPAIPRRRLLLMPPRGRGSLPPGVQGGMFQAPR